MFNLNQFILLTLYLSLFDVKSSIGLSSDTNCNSIKCDSALKCKKDSSLKHINGTCCPVCVCDQCADLNYEICSDGFKPIKQTKLADECCEIIACISNADQDELIINIEKYSQNDDDDDNDLISNDYNLNQDEANDNDSEETYINDDNENETILNEDPMCSNYKCSDEKYKFYKQNSKCPKDSQLVDVNLIEKQCCQVDKSCACNECPDKSEMIEWCKLAGNNFEAVVVQKAEHTPGKCCDVHICHSPNFTCNLNGVFYPHNSKWKLNTCTDCLCEMGHIKCNKISCPVLDCEVKQSLTSECCPVCTGECLGSNDKIYKPNETWKEDDDDCIECKCVDGQKVCITESCNPSSCSNAVKTSGVCCPTCPNQNYTHRGYLKYPPHCKSKALIKCNTTCKYGFKLDGNRCPTCTCSDVPMGKCPFDCDSDMAYMPLNNRICDCSKKCPHLACDLKCLNGFEKTSNGCDECKCKEEKQENKCVKEAISNDIIWSDGCRQCTCNNGHQFCSLISCKKLECSNSIYLKDSCCPSCPDEFEQSNLQTNTTTCFSPKSGQIYLENDQWQLDKCTNCTCRNGIVLCDVNECKPVACSNPVYNKEDCCSYCAEDLNKFNLSKKYWSCFDSNDLKRPHGSVWKENDCLHCVCQNGERKCFNIQESCPELDCLQTILKKGQCCPYCLDSIHSPYILSLLNNLTILKANQNQKPFNAISNYIIYFLVLIVIALVVLVIILLFKVIGGNPNLSRRYQRNRSNQKKIFELKAAEQDLKSNKNCYSIGNVTIPIGENENLVSLATNRDFSPLLLSCDNTNSNQSDHLNTNNSSELSSDSFNNDDNSKSTLISNKTDETIVKSSMNPSQNRIICYL